MCWLIYYVPHIEVIFMTVEGTLPFYVFVWRERKLTITFNISHSIDVCRQHDLLIIEISFSIVLIPMDSFILNVLRNYIDSQY